MKSKNNFFFDQDQFFRIDTRRIVYFLVFVGSFLLTEAGRKIYRPFIYENHYNDYGIADSVGNWGGIIVQIFFSLTILNSSYKKGFRIIGFLVAGYILYEILQPYLPKGVFDWQDIYGTFLGAIIGIAIYTLQHRLLRDNKVFYKFNRGNEKTTTD